MKFRARMMLSAVIPACLFATAVSASLLGHLEARRGFDHFLDRELKLSSGLSEMHTHGLQMGQALRDIVLDPANRQGHDNLQAARQDYERAYADTLTAAAGLPAQEALRSLRALRERHAAAQERVLALTRTDPAAAMRNLIADETPAWRTLNADLLAQLDQAHAQAATARQAMQTRTERTTRLTLALALLALLSSVLAAVASRRAVARELGDAPARPGARLAPEAGDSIEAIAASVRRVSDSLGDIAPSAPRQRDAATAGTQDRAGDASRRADTLHR